MRETGEGEAGAACFEAGASLARPHAGSPWPPRLSLYTRHIDEAIPHRFLTNVFYINIILALWLSRAMHRCASGRSHAQSKGFLAVPVIKHCGVSPTSVSPSPFLSVLFGKETCQDNVIVLPSCRKSCFLLAQRCAEVNMSMLYRFVPSSSILFI